MSWHERMMRDVYGETLIELARENPDLVVVGADLMRSNGSAAFAAALPERAFNTGVAEANMIGLGAGLASVGKRPLCDTFACFATRRVYDQIAISVAYAGLGVVIVGTDPGVTAEMNGGTHMPFDDLALMRLLPGMTVLAPCDACELRAMLRWLAGSRAPAYLQLTRRKLPAVFDEGYAFTPGHAETLAEGGDVTLVSTGFLTHETRRAVEILAGEGIRAHHLHLGCLKPLDDEAILAAARETGAIVTCENGYVAGGLGAAVAELLAEEEPVPMRRIGVRDRFGEVGTINYLMEKHRLRAQDIAATAREVAAKKSVCAA